MDGTYERKEAFDGVLANRSRSEQGAILGALLALILLIVIVGAVPFFIFGKSVHPNEIGIRQNYYDFLYFLKKGFSEEGLSPGLRWQVPGVSRVVTIPRDFQFVQFDATPDSTQGAFPALDIPTTDGSKVNTEITIVLRFFDSKEQEIASGDDSRTYEKLKDSEIPLPRAISMNHGGPRELLAEYTGDLNNIRRIVAKQAEDALKIALRQLSTIEFYNPGKREKQALAAEEQLARNVAPSGIEIFGALIQRYVYAERTIDDQIFAKNLQDQTERMNAAASQLAAAQAETEQKLAYWDAKIRDLTVEGESSARVIRSEGDLERAKRHAEGDLLVAEARAEIDRAKAMALASSPGADVYLSREMAPILGTLRGGVVTGIDPFHINQWMERLGSKGGSAR